MHKDRDAPIQKYKPEAMCKPYIAMIHVVAFSISIRCFVLHLHVPTALTFKIAFELDQDKNLTMQNNGAMIHVAVLQSAMIVK